MHISIKSCVGKYQNDRFKALIRIPAAIHFRMSSCLINKKINLIIFLYGYETRKVLKRGAGEGWRRSVGPSCEK
jgi:hypothetical protein